MKKFIAAFDGLDFSESTMHYAIYLARKCQAHLVGVFLEDFTRHSYGMADVTHYEGQSFDQRVASLNIKDNEQRKSSIEIFEHACQDAGLNYSVHRDHNLAIQELLRESVYADLLVMSPDESLNRFDEIAPTRFAREILQETHCPVMLVPNSYRPIEKIILLYDGQPSSVFAVRSFSYLFEAVKEVETEVLTVKGPEESGHLPDNRLIKEFVKRHFPKAEYLTLKGYAEEEIQAHIKKEKKACVVVLGAYRRGRISRLFHRSMADHLMSMRVPLFIAHN
ncbi:MAG: universal stress protein [Flavisolibacter sp.]